MRLALILSLAVLCLVSGAAAPAPDAQEGWRTFEGSWSASGQRQSLPTESQRPASIVYLSGSVVITSGDGVGKGFRGEAIGFDDGTRVSVGRCVWTDEHGDRIFSTLSGDAIGAGRRFAGTITGGTGRYAGITGDYTFEWQYVVQGEASGIQGRAVGLKGRFRAGTEAGR
jgi:hypothetical protein